MLREFAFAAGDWAHRFLGDGLGRWLLMCAIVAVPASAALLISRKYLAPLSAWANRTFTAGSARRILIVLTLAAPVVTTWGLTRLYAKASPFDFVSNAPNDFVDYWHEVATFRAVGFDGGYYTSDETPARAMFTRFGVHGPVYVALVGTPARILGWKESSPVFFNMAFVSAGLALFIGLARPDGMQLLLIFLSTVVCWPIVFMIPTSSQESLHQAGAIVLAGLIWGRSEPASRQPWLRAALALIVALALIRFSWGLLLLPVTLIAYRGRPPGARTVAAALSVAATIALIWIWWWLAAPGHNMIFDGLHQFGSSPLLAFGSAAQVVPERLHNFMARPALDSLVRLEMVALSIGIPAYFLYTRTTAAGSKDRFFPEGWLLWFNAAAILGGSLLLYDDPSFYRTFATPVLLSWFGFILMRQYAVVLVAIAAQLLLSFSAPAMMSDWTPNFELTAASLTRLKTTFAETLTYAPPPASPWCNTILLSTSSFDGRLTQVPPGFGLSAFNPRRPPQGPVKSKFLLLTADELSFVSRTVHLKAVGLLPGSQLSLVVNAESACR